MQSCQILTTNKPTFNFLKPDALHSTNSVEALKGNLQWSTGWMFHRHLQGVGMAEATVSSQCSLPAIERQPSCHLHQPLTTEYDHCLFTHNHGVEKRIRISSHPPVSMHISPSDTVCLYLCLSQTWLKLCHEIWYVSRSYDTLVWLWIQKVKGRDHRTGMLVEASCTPRLSVWLVLCFRSQQISGFMETFQHCLPQHSGIKKHQFSHYCRPQIVQFLNNFPGAIVALVLRHRKQYLKMQMLIVVINTRKMCKSTRITR